jgi:hypothetical protein
LEWKRDGYYIAKWITNRKKLPIVCLADLHVGHKNFNEAIFKKVLRWIVDHDAVWFGGGDLIECSTKTSVGAGWAEQKLDPQQQIDYIIEYLEPIKSRCLGMASGNHEDRAYKSVGINPVQIICHALGLEYAGDELFAIIAANRKELNKGKTYTLYACHTKSTNKNAGLAFNSMNRDMGNWAKTDIICKAHGHDMGLSPPFVTVDIDTHNLAVVQKENYYWLVGHYLDRPNSYIAKASKQPKPIGTIALWLDMDTNKPKIVQGEYIR